VGSGDTAIRWAVRLGKDWEKIEMDCLVVQVFKGEDVIQVSIDEEWLFELTPSHYKSPSISGPDVTSEKEGNQEDKEDKEDTLKAASPRPRTAVLVKGQDPPTPQSPAQARLSGLFHAWVDTNQHPAPPSTPQLTLVGGDATTALAGLLSEGMEDQLVISPTRTQVDDGTPTRASGGEMVSDIPDLAGVILISRKPQIKAHQPNPQDDIASSPISLFPTTHPPAHQQPDHSFPSQQPLDRRLPSS
jgi:hypothetical protein